MDGVVHPNVEQAIGRDRIRKALKRYENRPADEHRYGIVRSVNEDGSYEVLLDGDVQTSRCAQYGTALVGDRVLAVTKKDGRNDLIGRLGGEIGGGGTVDPAIEQRFEGIEADILDMRTNKVLWSGELWPIVSQTATLSEAVSAQPNGIVLVWSWYSTDTYDYVNANFMFTFVPKHFAMNHSSNGINCSGLCADGHMWKYVYIQDTAIKGYKTNDSVNTTGGVTMNSNNYVLRYVLGV